MLVEKEEMTWVLYYDYSISLKNLLNDIEQDFHWKVTNSPIT